ncbi:hypothetical protein RCL1_004527 [Eukaryota sp. TZLM3-RCL]
MISEITQLLVDEFKRTGNVSNFEQIRRTVTSKHKKQTPKTADIFAAIPSPYREPIQALLKIRPVRSASGVMPIALMCKPHPCPHQETTGLACVYCPGGVSSDFEFSTQSYCGYEPTSMRAIKARYHPHKQITVRLEQIKSLGHNSDKIEVIVMGGTFFYLPKSYRDWFIKEVLDALSDHESHSVEEAVLFAERSKYRCVGLTIETRPDYCSPVHLVEMLSYGATRLEIGVQSPYQDVLTAMNRGHGLDEVKLCFRDSRHHGFKVIGHFMPFLPGVDVERELYGWTEIWQDPSLRPDGLKLYPTLVMRGTVLHDMYVRGEYKPPTHEEITNQLGVIMSMIPPWVRLYRVQRDIPIPLVTAGADVGNLRELGLAASQLRGEPCREVRTREVGIRDVHDELVERSWGVKVVEELVRRDFIASDGWEVFLSFEDAIGDCLAGMLRLRWLEEEKTAMVREVHVYGTSLKTSTRDTESDTVGTFAGSWQHQGLGKLLLEQAEMIASNEWDCDQVSIISGLGVRKYYAKFGYELDNKGYMTKNLS